MIYMHIYTVVGIRHAEAGNSCPRCHSMVANECMEPLLRVCAFVPHHLPVELLES